jgi:hypothetical protein
VQLLPAGWHQSQDCSEEEEEEVMEGEEEEAAAAPVAVARKVAAKIL